jgi:hypothetical protein
MLQCTREQFGHRESATQSHELEHCTRAHQSCDLEFVLPMAYKQALVRITIVRATS